MIPPGENVADSWEAAVKMMQRKSSTPQKHKETPLPPAQVVCRCEQHQSSSGGAQSGTTSCMEKYKPTRLTSTNKARKLTCPTSRCGGCSPLRRAGTAERHTSWLQAWRCCQETDVHPLKSSVHLPNRGRSPPLLTGQTKPDH